MSAVDWTVSSSDEAFFVGERERGLVGVGHARDRRRRLARRDVAHRRQRLVPAREQVAEDRALGREPPHLDGRLADDPQPALGAEHHLADGRPGRGGRDRAGDQQPGRRDHAQPAGGVGDVAVAVGLHARRARRDPAPERRVRERVGVVAERVALGVELLLQPRPVDAGLHPREARDRVDAQHAVHPLEVDGEHGPRLLPRRLQRARDARAAAERDHHRVGLQRGAQHLGHRRLVARAQHEVGDAAEVAAALADEVAQALAARVDDAVVRVVGDVALPHRRLERRA